MWRGVEESSERYRVVYASTDRAGAFGETIARYRPDLALLQELKDIDDDEPLEPWLEGGVVPADYRLQRRLGETILDPSLRFVDVFDARAVQALRPALSPIARRLGLPDVDLSTVMGPNRELTKQLSLYLHEQRDEQGHPRYAGIRYVSRMNANWELWAVFDDRLMHAAVVPEDIYADDPGLVEAARLLGVNIEVVNGHLLFTLTPR